VYLQISLKSCAEFVKEPVSQTAILGEKIIGPPGTEGLLVFAFMIFEPFL
jgi:hypothetical protein